MPFTFLSVSFFLPFLHSRFFPLFPPFLALSIDFVDTACTGGTINHNLDAKNCFCSDYTLPDIKCDSGGKSDAGATGREYCTTPWVNAVCCTYVAQYQTAALHRTRLTCISPLRLRAPLRRNGAASSWSHHSSFMSSADVTSLYPPLPFVINDVDAFFLFAATRSNQSSV